MEQKGDVLKDIPMDFQCQLLLPLLIVMISSAVCCLGVRSSNNMIPKMVVMVSIFILDSHHECHRHRHHNYGFSSRIVSIFSNH